MSEQITITHEDEAAPSDVQTVWDGLTDFNRQFGGHATYRKLILLVRDDSGAVVGGLLGATYWNWLAIEILWLAPSIRKQGTGSKLLAMAEQIARERGCVAAHVDTHSFQAPDFYLRHGYQVFGVLDDLPAGYQRIFLRKRLDAPAEDEG